MTVADYPADGTEPWGQPLRDYLEQNYARAVSSDGSFGLPAPTGVGFEWLFVADELEGPYMNGVEL